jgi:hypothetical protein
MCTDCILGESFTNLKSYTINEIKIALEITAAYFKLYLPLPLLQNYSKSKIHSEHESASKSA